MPVTYWLYALYLLTYFNVGIDVVVLMVSEISLFINSSRAVLFRTPRKIFR